MSGAIPTPESLDALAMGLPGTVGEARERDLIRRVIALSHEHGLGHVAQLAAQMDDLWRRPERLPFYEFAKRQWVSEMTAYRAMASEPHL